MSYTLELPGVYLDAVLEDSQPVVGAPTLINRDPVPAEFHVPADTAIAFEVANVDAAGTVDAASIIIKVNGVVAFTGGAAQPGFAVTTSTTQADTRRYVVQPDVSFDSEELVTVEVTAANAGQVAATSSYVFTIADFSAPHIVSAVALDLQRVRVAFNEGILELADASPGSALTPGNWTLDRYGDLLRPLVSANVVRAEAVDTSTIDIFTDIPLTPGGTYVVNAENLEDLAGNAIAAPYNTAEFLGWTPPVPDGRDFDLWKKLPRVNRQEDETGDLRRIVNIVQEATDLLLYDTDRFLDILDPNVASESWLDSMLEDLGNPFAFDLDAEDKRRLVLLLVDMYRLKGTAVGIQNVVRFFLGLEVVVDPFNGFVEGELVLGESLLGVDWTLGTSDSGLLYSFEVRADQLLNDTQRAQITSIVEYMKPAHEHFVRLVEPPVPVVIDHLELGLSELGVNWELHA